MIGISAKPVSQIYFWLIRMLGGEGRMSRELEKGRPLIVLNLHQISPRKNPFWSPLHPALFEELLRFIASHFRVTTFSDCRSEQSGRPPLILSFDDGYYDYLEYAVPLLRKYGFPSNQNIIAECALSGQPPEIVRLCDFLGTAPRSLIGEIRLPGFDRRLLSDDVDDKVRFGNALCAFLKMRPRSESAPLWQTVRGIMSRLDGFAVSRTMTTSEIRQVAGEHEIGCHSFAHDSMEFEDQGFFASDLDRCKTFFRNHLALPLRVYAFPNGSFRPAQVEVLLNSGVEHVLLVGDGYASTNQPVYPRFNFYARSRSEVHLRALGYTATSSRLRMALKRVAGGSAASVGNRPSV